MAKKTWEQKTDDTLERIEDQSDNSKRQTGWSSDFREKVVTSLTKIESSLEQNTKDHMEIKDALKKIPKIEAALEQNVVDHTEIKSDLKDLKLVTEKIPLMEKGLNNHLHAHDMLKKSIYYPVALIVIAAALGVLGKLIFHIF